MRSHLLALLLFAGLVSTVFATLARDDRRGRWHLGARIFVALVLSVILLGWLMSRLPD